MSPVLDFFRNLFKRTPDPEPLGLVEELWEADLSDEARGLFRAQDQGSYAAAYSEAGLDLSLRRGGLFAWTEAPGRLQADFALEAAISFPDLPEGAYGAAGLVFRAADDADFYTVLVSTKGYLRLDLVFSGTPRTLIPWTECAAAPGAAFTLRLLARGPHLVAYVDGNWVGEAEDSSLRSGSLAFAAQAYGEGPLACRLEALAVETRPLEVEAAYYRYNYYEQPSTAARSRFAEALLATGEALGAAVQLRKAEAREALAARDLFLRAEALLRLDLHEEAAADLEACLALEPGHREAREEKANLLYLRGRYLELRTYVAGLIEAQGPSPRLLTLAGHGRFNLGDYLGAAEDYAAAAALAPEQPLCRMNEARAREQAGDRAGAARAFLQAAKGFFEAEAADDLALAMARLGDLDPRNPDLATLRAKILYREGRTQEARKALETLEAAGSRDSAVPYLLGLLDIEAGRREAALPRLERAADLEPTYPLYAFRLAECHVLLGSPEAPRYLARALAVGPEDGWTCNLAAGVLLQEALSAEAPAPDLAEARRLLEVARRALPGEVAVAVNLAALEGLEGRAEAGLALLEGYGEQGAARNAAGNLLASSGRLPEASREYRRAIEAEPTSLEYRANLVATLLELEAFSEAEEVLRKALDLADGAPAPASTRARLLLLTGNLALAYGEWVRAEAAYRLGLEAQAEDPGLLLALGRTYLGWGKADKARDCLARLRVADPRRAGSLEAEIEEATTETLGCASCDRTWRVPRDLPAQSGASIRAMPPDESPAGACPRCGKVYCIACRKDHLVDSRFTCPDCGEALKLSDNRLRYLVRLHLEAHERGAGGQGPA